MSKKEGADGIMDKISESQQEAIEYLTSQIEELRVQLQQEEAKVAGFIEKSVSNQDTIQVLEEENHAVAAQILQREKQLETIKQDLSTKLGENACLRDEIVELEQRLQNMEQVDNGNSQLEHQRKTIRKGSSSPKRTLSLGQDAIKTPERRLRRNDSETELSFMTVEMENGDQGDADLIESFKQNENQNNMNATKKFDILKKAMKQKYEKKIRKLKETVSAREDEVKELKRTLKSKESELRRSQEDAEDMEIKRVFLEAEMNQETEGLRTVLKDRCLQVETLKKALLRLQRETGNDLSQSNLQTISNLLIDGVGAGVDYIGSFMSSFDAEDHADRS
jgi:regulator of replication initiation timing